MPLTPELQELAKRVSNWGRWGDSDERGTANLIDEDAAARGAACIRTGRSFSLAVPLDKIKSPQEPGGAPGRTNPLRTMLSINQTYTGDDCDAAFNDDTVSMSLSAGTHIDSLAHVTYDGQMYNGHSVGTVTAVGGATKCGVEKIGPIVTRGVLLDLPAVMGVERLEQGYALTAADLDEALEHTGVELHPGDAVLVRTGQMKFLHGGEIEEYNHDSPGLSVDTIEWIASRDLGAVFTDTYIYEVWPPEDWSCMMPVHMIHLRDMGQVQGQNFDCEALAADCAEDSIYEFMLVVAADPFVGGCSAPASPVATK